MLRCDSDRFLGYVCGVGWSVAKCKAYSLLAKVFFGNVLLPRLIKQALEFRSGSQ